MLSRKFYMQLFTKLSNRFKYSKRRKLQTSAQTRLTAKTIYAAPANRTRRATAQTYLQSLKTLGSTVERARCHIILATLQSRKQSILSQRGVLEFVLGHFFINLLQKFEIVASVVIAVNECIRFFPVTPAILTTWTSFDASVSFLDVPEPQAVKEKTDAAAAITATIRLLMRLLDIYCPFLSA